MIVELGFTLVVIGSTGAFAAAVAAPSALRWPAFALGLLVAGAGAVIVVSRTERFRGLWQKGKERREAAARKRETWEWRTRHHQNHDGSITLVLEWPNEGWHDRTPSPWADRAMTCSVNGPTDGGTMQSSETARGQHEAYVEFPAMFTPTLGPPPFPEGTYEYVWEVAGERRKHRGSFHIEEHGWMSK